MSRRKQTKPQHLHSEYFRVDFDLFPSEADIELGVNYFCMHTSLRVRS